LATTTPVAAGKQIQTLDREAARARWLSGATAALGVVLAAAGLSCGGSGSSPSPVPADPSGSI
jgi:hypothetical protein